MTDKLKKESLERSQRKRCAESLERLQNQLEQAKLDGNKKTLVKQLEAIIRCIKSRQ